MHVIHDPARVDIPPALAADIAAHPEKYRPSVYAGEDGGEEVLILGTRPGAGTLAVGHIGYVQEVTLARDEIWVGWSTSGDDPNAPGYDSGDPLCQQRGVTAWAWANDLSPADCLADLMDRLAAGE